MTNRATVGMHVSECAQEPIYRQRWVCDPRFNTHTVVPGHLLRASSTTPAADTLAKDRVLRVTDQDATTIRSTSEEIGSGCCPASGVTL